MLFRKSRWLPTEYLAFHLRRHTTLLLQPTLVVTISFSSGPYLSCLESVDSWSCKWRLFEQYLLLESLKEQWLDCAWPMTSLYFISMEVRCNMFSVSAYFIYYLSHRFRTVSLSV
jgi:hypothetical protein